MPHIFYSAHDNKKQPSRTADSERDYHISDFSWRRSTEDRQVRKSEINDSKDIIIWKMQVRRFHVSVHTANRGGRCYNILRILRIRRDRDLVSRNR